MPCLLQTARPLQTSWAPGASVMRSKHGRLEGRQAVVSSELNEVRTSDPPCAGTMLEILPLDHQAFSTQRQSNSNQNSPADRG